MIECKSDCLLNIDGKCSILSKKDMTELEKWENDFKGFINELSMPEDDYNGIMKYIDEVPNVPNEPKIGHWKEYNKPYDIDGTYYCYCDNCGGDAHEKTDFCPNCGCAMKGESE